jgi:hypothetical protein
VLTHEGTVLWAQQQQQQHHSKRCKLQLGIILQPCTAGSRVGNVGLAYLDLGVPNQAIELELVRFE